MALLVQETLVLDMVDQAVRMVVQAITVFHMEVVMEATTAVVEAVVQMAIDQIHLEAQEL